MKHVWTLDESPARAGRRPGALAEYKALRDSCVWRPAVLSHKLLILRNGGQTVPHQHCNWGASIAFDGDI